jgi:adenine-specific DNA-methyltransferase
LVRRKSTKSSKPKKVKIPKRIPKEEKVKQYVHNSTKRSNNPPVGLVTPETDKDMPVKKYSYDPHLDPSLIWTGKTEKTSFEVDTVSLHVHERIDPLTIIEKVMRNHEDGPKQQTLFEFFEQPENNPPLREAIEFYKHDQGWSNRLIAGDSLLVMNSLLQKEGLAGKVQMIYIDPPYGIKYGSNFQPFVNKQTVTDAKDEDLTQEPETIKAFRDTWELGIHSYLTYLRDRLLLGRELLSNRGSIFVQISEENIHYVRELMDEIFDADNFVGQITVKRVTMFAKKLLNNAVYYIIWYAKNKPDIKYHQLFTERTPEFMVESAGSHLRIESPDSKESRALTSDERSQIVKFMREHKEWKLYQLIALNANGTEKQDGLEFQGKIFYPPSGLQWKTSYEGLRKLKEKNRLEIENNTLRYKTYLDDFPIITMNSLWDDIGPASDKIYAVQTPTEIIKRCMLMTTDPSDLVFDPTCGSGTTAYVA